MNPTPTLAERLVQTRTDRGLSQRELAERVGLAQQTYSNLERGLVDGTSRIASLAYALGVSAYWLETGIGLATTEELGYEERIVVEKLRGMTPKQRKGFLAFIAPETFL